MKIIADLQLHSKYSRAVSPKMNVEEIYSWALRKGIGLIATGDWTHPLWMRELQEKLEEDGSGLLRIKQKTADEIRKLGNLEISNKTISNFDTSVKFLLATEVSSIYSQGDKVRRIHNLIWVPTFKSAHGIIDALLKRGCNLGSDGRPIIGLTSKEVVELVLSVDETALVIPAHAWTPWFSLYGSKSGFDSIEECFGKYQKYIYAIETGLSSDPVMNWSIPDLDNRAILSFSDAHSGAKLGREATVFDVEKLDYASIRQAIINSSKNVKTDNRKLISDNRITCTFEFYPEEGKYHYDGHRACNIRQTPKETKKKGSICPVCGRPLTVGVSYRVEELAKGRTITPVYKQDKNGVRWVYHPDRMRPPFVNLVPLLEILSEALGGGVGTQKVQSAYEDLTNQFAGEFNVLLKTPLTNIETITSERVSEAIKRVREGSIFIDPGYDGVFGVVKVWGNEKKDVVYQQSEEQMGLF